MRKNLNSILLASGIVLTTICSSCTFPTQVVPLTHYSSEDNSSVKSPIANYNTNKNYK